MTDHRPGEASDSERDSDLERRLHAAFRAASVPGAPDAVHAEIARLRTAPKVRARAGLGRGSSVLAAAVVVGLFVVAGSLLSVGSQPSQTPPVDATGSAATSGHPSGEPSTTPAPAPTATPTSAPTAEPTPWPEESMAPSPNDELALAGRDGQGGRLYCNNRPFTFEGLAAPDGAEDRVGPEYDVLRSLIGTGMDVSWAPPGGKPTFREAARDPTGVVFLNERFGPAAMDGGPYAYITLDLDAAGWTFGGSGDCQPRGIPGPDFGQAIWKLDPAFAKPDSDVRTLHLLVQELACSGGQSASGRISPAFVVETPDQVAIELFVQEDPGGSDCQGNPWTPATLRLPSPLGDRSLLDVGAIGLGGAGG